MVHSLYTTYTFLMLPSKPMARKLSPPTWLTIQRLNESNGQPPSLTFKPLLDRKELKVKMLCEKTTSAFSFHLSLFSLNNKWNFYWESNSLKLLKRGGSQPANFSLLHNSVWLTALLKHLNMNSIFAHHQPSFCLLSEESCCLKNKSELPLCSQWRVTFLSLSLS